MSILSCAFYLGDTVQTAQRLLGKYVVRMLDGQALVARITETEAYVGRMDKAAHAYNYRQTARNAAMFGPPGHAYVYMIYGMHHCLNFVTEPEGEPSAVLLRGLEPVYGLDEMARLRFGKNWDALARTQRRNITNGLPEVTPPHYTMHTGKRIGIDYAEEAADFPWRFWLEREDG